MKVQYTGTDGRQKDVPDSTVTLDKNEDEDKDWKHTWTGLPKFMPDSQEYESVPPVATNYTVVELTGSDYVQVGTPIEKPDATFTITNKPVIDFTVEKMWNGVPAAADDWTVTVQLYRSVNGGAGEAVGSEVTLSKATSWKHTFPDLDKYDAYGNQYTYYAREVSVKVDGTTVAVKNDVFQVTVSGEELDFAVDHVDTPTNAPTKTTITNRTKGQLTVTKYWWDEGAAASRPQSVTVGLYVQGDGGSLTQAVDNKGTQISAVELKAENSWTHTFTNLPEYDNGVKITYVVRELDGQSTIAEGDALGDYTVHYGAGEVHNFRYGDLTIRKELEGSAVESERAFAFELAFTFPKGMLLPESFSYTVYEPGQAGNTGVDTGTLDAEEGGTISLKGGQWAVVKDLPAGTEYTVTELEANQNGYATTVTGAVKDPAGTATGRSP